MENILRLDIAIFTASYHGILLLAQKFAPKPTAFSKSDNPEQKKAETVLYYSYYPSLAHALLVVILGSLLLTI